MTTKLHKLLGVFGSSFYPFMRVEVKRWLRKGLPFITVVFGGSLGLRYFASLRYEFRNSQQEAAKFRSALEEAGVELPKTKEEAEERERRTVEKLLSQTVEDYDQVRGPRPWEDNQQYLEAKQRYTEADEAERKQLLQEIAARRRKAKEIEEDSKLKQIQARTVYNRPVDPDNPDKFRKIQKELNDLSKQIRALNPDASIRHQVDDLD